MEGEFEIMEFDCEEIYVKGEPAIILRILELARENLGNGVRKIDLNPELKEED